MPATATKTRRDWLDVLRRIDACEHGMRWAKRHGTLTARQAWQKCDRGDWMIYVAAKLGVFPKLIATATIAYDDALDENYDAYVTAGRYRSTRTERMRECAGLVRKAIPWEAVAARIKHTNGAK